MQAALRSATRRAVAISSRRRGVATNPTTTKSATASEDWLAEHEKAWVKAMVQREVRAQMVAEEERRVARDRLRAAEEEELRTCRRCRLADDAPLIPRWVDYTLAAMKGGVLGFWVGLAILLSGR